LPYETSLINRLAGDDALDLLGAQVTGLKWELLPRGLAASLGIDHWETHIAKEPNAPQPARPFDWWPHLDDLLARAWKAHGVRPGESTASAMQRWLGPQHYSRAREAYAASLGPERRHVTKHAVT
jgi:hypothetical protein